MATRIPAIRNQINLLKSHASPPGQPSVKARIPPTEPRVDDVTLNLPKPPADIGRFLYAENHTLGKAQKPNSDDADRKTPVALEELRDKKQREVIAMNDVKSLSQSLPLRVHKLE